MELRSQHHRMPGTAIRTCTATVTQRRIAMGAVILLGDIRRHTGVDTPATDTQALLGGVRPITASVELTCGAIRSGALITVGVFDGPTIAAAYGERTTASVPAQPTIGVEHALRRGNGTTKPAFGALIAALFGGRPIQVSES